MTPDLLYQEQPSQWTNKHLKNWKTAWEKPKSNVL